MKKLLCLLFFLGLCLASASADQAVVTPSSTTYSPAGGQITFSVTLTYPTNASSVTFTVKPPSPGWTYVSTNDPTAFQVAPHSGDFIGENDATGVFAWFYDPNVLPTGNGLFTFILSYPAGLTGTQSFVCDCIYKQAGVLKTIPILPIVLGAGAAIATQPVDATKVAGQTATFTVGVSGAPTPTIKWQRSTDNGANWTDLANDATYGGATSNALTVANVTVAMSGQRFRAIASNNAGPDATSNSATLTVQSAPTIVTHPRSQAASLGGNVSLTVVATGTPAPTYQWKKGGVDLADVVGHISGATTATLTLTGVLAGDAGDYTVLVSNGIAPNATSNVATLSTVAAGFAAAHALLGAGYQPGGMVTITNTITYTGELDSLSWSVLIPAGWSFVSAVNVGGPSAPNPNDISVLDWAWSTPPPSGSTFTYTLNVPANATGDQTIAALVEFGTSPTPIQLVAGPDPLILKLITYHTADTNQNFKIDLTELTRVIALYNTRFDTGSGKQRTGAYKVLAGNLPDGFAPDTARASATVVTLPFYHAADFNQNGKIDLNELTRVITLYNTRYDTGSGKQRTGAYKPKPAGDTTSLDGYVTEPTRAP